MMPFLALLIVSIAQAKDVCYEEVGCFSQSSPWFSILRPFPAPMSPKEIDTRIYLYTRKSTERYNVTLGPPSSINGSDYDPSRATIFVTHGFASTGNVSWVNDLKDACLKSEDANVFIVDWGKGASLLNYLQVAANTRVVGAQVSRFLTELVEGGLNPNNVHLVGHSLGAHIMGYIGKGLLNNTAPKNATAKEIMQYKVGRITGLDPAQPGFELQPATVRLDKGDARRVIINHSDAKPFIPLFGFGYISPLGHVDFYLNQGSFQPNCFDFAPIHNVTSIADLGKVAVEVIAKGVACSHGRAYQIFISAINPNVSCEFKGKRIITSSILRDTGIFSTPIVAKTRCGKKDCVDLGLEDSNNQGSFQVRTSGKSPFCCRSYSFLTGCSN